MDRWVNKILLGLSEDILREMPDNCIDSIVTDPPYGLKFMGKKWDYDVPTVALWEEAYRVLKPGAHVLSFGGTRTYHRMVVNIEDAGFEIRDQILWIYGSGFPKSLNIGKAIDSLQGNERIVIGCRDVGHDITNNSYKDAKPERKIMDITKGNTAWEGWGTALKPAVEPICLARKPVEGTVANNVLKWGTGGLNIDGCRVGTDNLEYRTTSYKEAGTGEFSGQNQTNHTTGHKVVSGRFPANVIHDGSEEVLQHFPESNGQQGDVSGLEPSTPVLNVYGKYDRHVFPARNDNGSAARFFYCAKASSSERGDENNHPTVKPLNLIKYLIRLITPPDGIVLDMFGGSGTTALACLDLGFPYIVIEKEPDHVFIANERIKQATRQERLFL
jgi:DNA modification methylase